MHKQVDLAISFDDRGSIRRLDCRGRIDEIDVVNDKGASSGRSRDVAESGQNAHVNIVQCAVRNDHGTSGDEGATSLGEVETDATIIDRDRLVQKDPIPILVDGSKTIVERQVPCGPLLIACEQANAATIEDKIFVPASGAIVHEDALTMLALALGKQELTYLLRVIGVAGRHVEDDVLNRGALGDLPVQAVICSRLRHVGHVEYKVTNLAPEIVLVLPPAHAIGKIWIRVEKGYAEEVGCTFDDRQVGGITDELSVVEHDQRSADDIRAGREVNGSRSGGLGFAASVIVASVAVESGFVDSISVVGHAIALFVSTTKEYAVSVSVLHTFRSVVSDIPPDSIRAAVFVAVWYDALALYVGVPVG